jgi:hypothetical protein
MFVELTAICEHRRFASKSTVLHFILSTNICLCPKQLLFSKYHFYHAKEIVVVREVQVDKDGNSFVTRRYRYHISWRHNADDLYLSRVVSCC